MYEEDSMKGETSGVMVVNEQTNKGSCEYLASRLAIKWSIQGWFTPKAD